MLNREKITNDAGFASRPHATPNTSINPALTKSQRYENHRPAGSGREKISAKKIQTITFVLVYKSAP